MESLGLPRDGPRSTRSAPRTLRGPRFRLGGRVRPGAKHGAAAGHRGGRTTARGTSGYDGPLPSRVGHGRAPLPPPEAGPPDPADVGARGPAGVGRRSRVRAVTTGPSPRGLGTGGPLCPGRGRPPSRARRASLPHLGRDPIPAELGCPACAGRRCALSPWGTGHCASPRPRGPPHNLRGTLGPTRHFGTSPPRRGPGERRPRSRAAPPAGTQLSFPLRGLEGGLMSPPRFCGTPRLAGGVLNRVERSRFCLVKPSLRLWPV